MPRTLSPDALEGVLASQTEQAYLALIDIGYEGVGSPWRFCNNSVDVVYGGITYTAFPFDITFPTNEQDRVAEAQLTIDNVSRTLIEILRTQVKPLDAIVRAVATKDLVAGLHCAMWIDLKIRSVEYPDATTITARLTNEDYLAEPFPKDNFTQKGFPGLFGRGVQGSYTPPALAGEPVAWEQVPGWVNANTGQTAWYTMEAFPDGSIIATGEDSSKMLDTNTLLWSPITSSTLTNINTGVSVLMSNGDFMLVSLNAEGSQTYNKALDTWTFRGVPPAAAAPQWQQGAMVSSNGVTYIFGGFEGSGPVTRIQLYDEAGAAWSASADALPIPMRRLIAVVLDDGRILVGGGESTGVNLRYWFYDPLFSTFTETTSILLADHRSAPLIAGRLDDGRVYIGGGQVVGVGNDTNHTMVFDPVAETWTQGIVPMPVDVSSAGNISWQCVKGIDGNFYLYREDNLSTGLFLPWKSTNALDA